MTTTGDPSDPEYRASLEAQNNFVGWYISGSRTSGVTCGTGVLHTSGTFAQCCVGNACLMNTRCADGILTEQDDNTIPCNSGFSCVTMELYSTYRIEDEVRRRVMCGSAWTAHTVYREIPAETTSSEPSMSSTASSGSSFASSTASPTPSASETPGGGNNDSGGSLAWIAGAVIGPIFLIAALVLGIWWYRRRKAAKAAAAEAATAQGGPDASTPALSQHYPQQHTPHMAQYHDNPMGQHDPRMSQQMWQHQQHQAVAGYGPPKTVSPHGGEQQPYGAGPGYYAPHQQQHDGSGYYSGAPTELDSSTRSPPPPVEMHSEPQRR